MPTLIYSILLPNFSRPRKIAPFASEIASIRKLLTPWYSSYTWSLTPLYGGTRTVLGFYNSPFETTRQKISERRTRTLLTLGASVALAKSVSSFWVQVLRSLEDNEFDFPFALLYSVLDDTESDESSISSESSQSMKSCVLEGSLGVPDGHPSAPTRLDLKRARGGFIPSFREAIQTREPKLLNISDGTLSESLMEGFQWRGFPEPCRLAVVCPVSKFSESFIPYSVAIDEFCPKLYSVADFC
jgi:hypothetical protein